MKIRILVNQLGDADSIFIGLSDEKRSLVILLDGGRKGDVEKLKGNLTAFLAAYGKKAPDLVLASHYDDDHIAGLQPLITPYGKDVRQIWAFDTQNLHDSIAKKEEKEGIFPGEDDVAAGAVYQSKAPEVSVLIESIAKEQELLNYAKGLGINLVQPVVHECSLADWPEIVILSPTRAYYDSLFPKNLKPSGLFIKQEEVKTDEKSADTAPCECLTLKRSPISAVNLNSCVLKITVEGRAFVFAADAGIDSFYHIENYEEELRNIFWLKVPHHGSANNLNKELIELMSPKVAVISGDKHVSGEIVRCLEKHGADVKTTRQGDIDMEF